MFLKQRSDFSDLFQNILSSISNIMISFFRFSFNDPFLSIIMICLQYYFLGLSYKAKAGSQIFF